MLKKISYFLLVLFVFNLFKLNSMVYDNRYFPLYLKPFVRKPCASIHNQIQPIFMRADSAQGELESMSIADIDGKYDLIQIIDSMLKAGLLKENPLRSDLQGIATLPFKREGRIDGQGLAFFYEQPILSNLAVGTSFLFMHVDSLVDFCIDKDCLEIGNGDRKYLFKLNGELNNILGVTSPIYNRVVFGDTDLYFRWAYHIPYFLKFRSIDIGVKFGTIIPTSPRTPYDNPAAIPLGGQRHWGFYMDLENQYEVREDWFIRLMFRAIKRLPATARERMPLLLEPSNYGAIKGQEYVNPGWSFVFNPSIRFDGIRDGFGITALYTLVSHLKNNIKDLSNNSLKAGLMIDLQNTNNIKPNLEPVEYRSSWGMEYVTVGAYYDFAKLIENPKTQTIFSFYWDIPVEWLVSKRSVRTNAISMLFDLSF